MRDSARQPRAAAHRAASRLNTFLVGQTPPPRWEMEGQCEGMTRLGERCKVHRGSKYAVAAPLRRGERFCGHHDPHKYTGVRCAGMKKHGKGQCRVWSNSCYKDADPLRCGSPFCHHHCVRCDGQTIAGKDCTVTSSSQHMHADPLRRGERFCAHHRANKPADPNAEIVHELAADEPPTCGEWCCICGVELVYGPDQQPGTQHGEDEELPPGVFRDENAEWL